MSTAHDLSQAEEDAWCDERRMQVATYLADEGVQHGRIGDWPAWHVAPIVSIWAIESLKSPGNLGWWAICGDLPTDYCSSLDCRTPRLAMRRIAENWLSNLAATRTGAETIGETGLPIELADLLKGRADTLLKWAGDDEIWTPDPLGS